MNIIRYLFAAALFAAAPGVAQQSEVHVPYVPTAPEVVDEMLRLARIGPGQVLYDLGSGDGRIVIQAARKYGARGVGIEIDPKRVQEARINARKAGVWDLVSFREQDLVQADLHEASAVTMYLLPWVNARIRTKLLRELKAGTRVVSHEFDIPGWTPAEVVQLREHKIYCWVVPEHALPGK